MNENYTQIYVHLVFSVKNRRPLIAKGWQNSLHKYIGGIIINNSHKPLAIGGIENHIHILLALRPTQSISELVKLIKCNSSKWINDNHLCRYKFEWQTGFGAFTYSKSQINQVETYIRNQEEHHKKETFEEEYNNILEKFGVNC